MNWEEEQPCFEGVATELGLFYSDLSAHYSHARREEEEAEAEAEAAEAAGSDDDEEEGDGGEKEEGEGEGDGEVGPVSKRYEYLLQVIVPTKTHTNTPHTPNPLTPTQHPPTRTSPPTHHNTTYSPTHNAHTQHVLYPAFRAVFLPPRELAAGSAKVVVQVAALSELYRVFERC